MNPSLHGTIRPRQSSILTLVLLSFICATGCKKSADDAPPPVVAVEAEHPEVGDLAEHIMADAVLSPLAQAAISAKITAPVRAFYVQRGSKVTKGQLLAVLENRDLSAQALDNKGQLMAAQATFEIETKGQVPEEYAKAELDATQSKAQLRLQAEIAASRRELFQQGAIPGRDYDTAIAALAQAQATYDAARNHLKTLSNVSNEAAKQVAQGQLASARGKYEASTAQMSYSQLRSPISGVVTDRPLFPGETSSPGTPLITVMDTSSLLAKVHLSQNVAQRLELGNDASVFIPGVDQPVGGKVSLISPALDPGSTTVEVWLKVSNSAGAYKAGTPVRVSLTGRTIPHAVKVPINAILTAEDGTKSVMTVSNESTAHKVGVRLGMNDGEDVEVTQGLNGSETVITNGSYGLSDGSKVRVGKPGTAGDEN